VTEARVRTVRALMRLSVSVAAVALLFSLAALFPPEGTSFFPKCVLHSATGLHCPGCGCARCLHALAHGEFRQAAAFNPLVLLVIPFLVYVGLRMLQNAVAHRQKQVLPARAGWVVLVVVLLFFVLRNLPWPPFTYLAPHRL